MAAKGPDGDAPWPQAGLEAKEMRQGAHCSVTWVTAMELDSANVLARLRTQELHRPYTLVNCGEDRIYSPELHPCEWVNFQNPFKI